jgi:uncharacterized protein (DUF486 family)
MRIALLLVISNLFMTLAWYGHLKHKERSLIAVILVSWLIALPEYIFQVPANRIGSDRFSVTQLKILQECISLAVFTLLAFAMFREIPRWNNLVSYALIVAAVYFSFGFGTPYPRSRAVEATASPIPAPIPEANHD